MPIQSWEVSDAFIQCVKPLIPHPKRDPKKQYKRQPGAGRKPIDYRIVFSAIVFVLRTGIQWKALPKERFGSPSAIHRYFLEWENAGFFDKLWEMGLTEYDEVAGIQWEWQSIDGSNLKAPLAQESVGRNPTDRGKNGYKRTIIVDERGVPLSIDIAPANRHDVTRLKAANQTRIVKPSCQTMVLNLCTDAGYVGQPAWDIIVNSGYIPHVRPRGEEKNEIKRNPNFKPRRWIVEVAHSWFNRFRKLLVRYEKTDRSFIALHQLAATIIALRKIGVIYG